MRILIDLPDSQIQALADLCERTNLSRAALIREAVADYIGRHQVKPMEAAFGLWGADALDGLEYQEKVRAEW